MIFILNGYDVPYIYIFGFYGLMTSMLNINDKT